MKIALLAIAFAGCKKPAESIGPPAIVELSGSEWTLVHGGDAPMIRGPKAHVFVMTSKSGDRLPGIALGTEAGPELSLLGGEFAPLVVPDRTDLPHQVRIASDG